MKRLFLAFIFVTLSLTLFAQRGEKSVIVSSVALDTMVAPDKIELSVTIQSDKGAGKKGLDIAQNNLFNILKEAGADIEKDVKISDSKSSYQQKNNDVLLYRAYMVTLKNISQVENIMQQAAKVGISNIYISSATTSKYEHYVAELSKKALLSARNKAEFQAAVLGQTIGKAVYISSYGSGNRYADSSVASFAKSSNNLSQAPQYDIEIKNITIRTSFEVHFILE